jgi:hypothetical protein
MPLSEAEREKIREGEILKSEIRRELQPEQKSGISESFQHQAVLLVLGFILTTVVGSWLAYFWKQRDWANQQSYLVAQRSLDKKYSIIDKTFRDVATTIAAAEDVLATYYGENWSPKDIEERQLNWHKTSRDWRVSSKVLRENLAANFANPDVEATFVVIIDKRRQLGNGIGNLAKQTKAVDTTDDTKRQVKELNDLAVEITKLLGQCGTLMTAETKAKPSDP